MSCERWQKLVSYLNERPNFRNILRYNCWLFLSHVNWTFLPSSGMVMKSEVVNTNYNKECQKCSPLQKCSCEGLGRPWEGNISDEVFIYSVWFVSRQFYLYLTLFWPKYQDNLERDDYKEIMYFILLFGYYIIFCVFWVDKYIFVEHLILN